MRITGWIGSDEVRSRARTLVDSPALTYRQRVQALAGLAEELGSVVDLRRQRGALALAAKEDRRARFEDVYSLLLPKKNDFRSAVYQACADTPDLDQTAESMVARLKDWKLCF